MKLHRLELEGFGPFLERQTVDFDAFEADGIFLIAGRTGAGKSSVLDGVCFALFGGVPRYDGGDKRLRSDHCAPDDPTEVSLEFTAAGRRWRVTRSPEYERPKARGGGLTTQAPQATLEQDDDGVWTGVAARPRDVAAALDEIVGLTQQQFLQVILLAQNRFARFLLARNDERQALLRTLFGTRTYGDYERILDERRKDAERLVAAGGEGARVLLDEGERAARDAGLDTADAGAESPTTRERLDALVRAADRAAYRVGVAEQERASAEGAVDVALQREREATALHDAQVRRLESRSALAALESDAAEIDAARSRGALAAAAETLRAWIDAAERAVSADAAARAAAETATAAWLSAGESGVSAEGLRLRDDELSTLLAQCADAVAAEAELSAAEASLTAAVAGAARADTALAELDDRRMAVAPMLAALDECLAQLAPAPAVLDAARARVAEVEVRRNAAREADALATAAISAERRAIDAATALVDATGAHTALLQRRLASAAGDLARGLVEGEECPVCGSAQHPRPAHPGDEPVTDAALDAAGRAKDAALAADRTAAETARTARAAHAEAAARAGGADLAGAEAALTEATATLAAAERDAAEATRVAGERAELAALDAEAALERDRLVTEAAAERQAAALADQRAAALRARVESARGTFASVAERAADLDRRRTLLRAVTESAADVAVRAQLRDDAVAERDRRLTDSPFADAGAARTALLDPAERRALDERVREHEAALRAHRQTLLDLELALADAPEEPVDLTPVRAQVADDRARLTTATAAAATAAATATRLRDLAERADAAHREVASSAERAAVLTRLANTVAGRAPNTHRMTLETFVLAAELEEIVEAANLRLSDMSAGRYRLQHSDALAARGAASGLGLAVHDAFTGQARPPQSLSGGETFLASLALALGLAEVVTARAGGIRLDTLFIDEGFGSLDDDTLDLAMRVLDELRQGGRTVGVISHVAAMKEQLPAQLSVASTPQGPSTIRQEGALAGVARA